MTLFIYKTTALLLVCSLLAVHADFQFLLTDYSSIPVGSYERFQHISRIPSSPDTFLVSVQNLYTNNSFGLVSYPSLAFTPLKLTYNGEDICCTQYTQPWVEYPEEAPEYIYTTAVSYEEGEEPFSTVAVVKLLKIATASRSVVLATTLPYRNFFVRDITALDVSPDGAFLYGIIVDEHNSTLLEFSTADFTITRSIPLETPSAQNLNNYAGPAWVDIAAGVEKLYLVSSYFILALDRATLTVQQNFSMHPQMNFGPNVLLDEEKDALFVTTHPAGYYKYGFIYNLTKLSLDPLALEATILPQEQVGEANDILIDHSRNVVYYSMRSYYINPQQLFTLDIDTFALINSTYLPGYESTVTFTNSSKNELLIATNNILGRLAIYDNVKCDYPIITSSLVSSGKTEYGSDEYTFSATIYNPSSSAITEFRFSTNCSNSMRAASPITRAGGYDSGCSSYYRLPVNTVIPAQGSFTFTYVKEYSNATADFKIDFVGCDSTISEPTTPPTTSPSVPPTSSPSDCSSISIMQSIQNEWQQDGVRDAVYNVFFTNSGSAKISSLVITASSGVTSLWNLDPIGNGKYRLPAYAMIEPGSSYAWGYIREGEGPATFTLSECSAQTTQPTQPPVTSPDVPISITQTAASTWFTNGQMCQQVDVKITNTSPTTAFSSIKLSSADFATVQQSWNIEKDASNNLVLPSYFTSLLPGSSFLFGYVNCGSLVTFQIAAAN